MEETVRRLLKKNEQELASWSRFRVAYSVGKINMARGYMEDLQEFCDSIVSTVITDDFKEQINKVALFWGDALEEAGEEYMQYKTLHEVLTNNPLGKK